MALVASRSKHRALVDGVSGVREWMAAAYKRCLQTLLTKLINIMPSPSCDESCEGSCICQESIARLARVASQDCHAYACLQALT